MKASGLSLVKVRSMNKNLRAFSLIEILIAVAILGLAASLIMPGIKQTKDKTSYNLSRLDLASVAKGMEHHYLEKGVYPVFATWADVSKEDSALREYVSDIPATDGFNRPYNVKESTEAGYTFEGFAIPGKLKNEYGDYIVTTGGKLKDPKKKN